MVLVDGPVRADGGAQLLGRLVIADLPQHRHQRGCAQVGGARGDDLAHPPDGGAVLAAGVDAEAAENLLSTRQTFLITADRREDAQLLEAARGSFHSICSLVAVDGEDVAGLEAAGGEQLHRGPALEQQLLLGHPHQDETHQFSQVQTAHHLLKADVSKMERIVIQKSKKRSSNLDPVV